MAEFESFIDKSTWARGTRYIARSDPILGRHIKAHGPIERELHDNYYESIVRSIVAQQVAWAAARKILENLCSLYGGKYPTPEEFLKTNPKKLRKAGLSPQKLSYITDLCERIMDGRLELSKFDLMENEAIIEELDAVRGIGRWTAQMFLMFSLGRTDVFPVDDLGIRKGMQKLYRMRELPKLERMNKIAKKWGPYGTIASLYLWAAQDGE